MTTTDEFVLCTVLKFSDGHFSAQALHRGDIESCHKVAGLINAVSYSGDKHVIESKLMPIPAAEWDRMVSERDEATQPAAPAAKGT